MFLLDPSAFIEVVTKLLVCALFPLQPAAAVATLPEKFYRNKD